MDSRSGL